ncbi:phosphonate metabolism protein/1,5-bisphosphokinase (PRPP-forming) PhnN [Thiomicrorhabdus aquaedulcis]|uniref:phosphonate metabolism protein/1,5-bisphosphokinase (PRPP-forming) PhnN n=1 Tax=Thiomicrorhabdus aquaedulcis TaxID=2211106 RepID=UPI001E326E46|nr:phosphonate metabolism protein/1,5-bisphosphokinase (PRPP-forming) PhnN [Thiomicrorhabdus aquaedulcis]
MNTTRPGHNEMILKSSVNSFKKGRLFYVLGASGVGKDSLLRYARPFLSQSNVLFAHRYITRAVQINDENHVSLSEDEFLNRQQKGCFMFAWHSHNLHYGIGIEVQDWLNLGCDVVINGSREYFNHAIERYPELIPVLISASLTILEQRLIARGRESLEQIHQRLQGALSYQNLSHPKLITINNNNLLEQAGKQLVEVLLGKCES